MRYTAEHKERTHERIVDAAARRFRRGGAGVGIGQLMKMLKMTHGGFYRHFKSKDDLLVQALAKGFEEMGSRMRAAVANAKPGHEVECIVNHYLSDAHCADAAGGCPVAALSSEIARQPRAVREAFDAAIHRVVETLSTYMSGKNEEERRRKAAALMSGMSGSLAVARAMSHQEQRRRFLEGARKTYIDAFGRRK